MNILKKKRSFPNIVKSSAISQFDCGKQGIETDLDT